MLVGQVRGAVARLGLHMGPLAVEDVEYQQPTKNQMMSVTKTGL
jgi:hypothetical protein